MFTEITLNEDGVPDVEYDDLLIAYVHDTWDFCWCKGWTKDQPYDGKNSLKIKVEIDGLGGMLWRIPARQVRHVVLPPVPTDVMKVKWPS